MKKFLVLCVMLFSVVSCFEDIVENCPTDTHPLWCNNNNVCCQLASPYNCGGACYVNNAEAWDHCGQFGGYVDVCRPE